MFQVLSYVMSGCFVALGLSYSPVGQAQTLSLENRTASGVALAAPVASISEDEGVVITSPEGKNSFFVESRWFSERNDPTLQFGSLKSDTADMARVSFDGPQSASYWRSVSKHEKGQVFLDAMLGRVVLRGKRGLTTLPSEIILDRLKPARDSRGEPTNRETATLRSVFIKQYKSLDRNRLHYFSLIPLPKTWLSENSHYLLQTDIPGFEVLKVQCQNKDGFRCIALRKCFVYGAKQSLLAGYRSMAVWEKKNLLLFAHPEKRRIDFFQYESCFHIAKISKTLFIENKIQDPTAIFIDKKEGLWLGTKGPDNFENASIYRWPAKIWQAQK